MKRGLRTALETARGRSEFVICVVADIRGFSAFSINHESPDVAMYIRRVYMRLIDDFFPFATFHKATGDGLLMTVPYEDATSLAENAQTAIESCLRCLDEFANIAAGDLMINFETPDKIGFGVARGTACCVFSGRTVLDYSGHLLNLTSRLMDLARPSGIVLDNTLGLEVLQADTGGLFEAHDVYIRSVAEDQPRTIYALKNVVEIPEQATRPLRFEHWETIKVTKTVRQWKEVHTKFGVPLPRRLKRPDGVMVELSHVSVRAGKPVRDLIRSLPSRTLGMWSRPVSPQFCLMSGR